MFQDIVISIFGLTDIVIPWYVVAGVFLMIIGLVLGAFIPVFQKIGLGIFLVGLVLSVGFSILESLWQNLWFKIVVVIFGTFILVWAILFPKDKVIPGKR